MYRLTKTAYHNMSKSQLVDFAWQLKEEYNELRSICDSKDQMIKHLDDIIINLNITSEQNKRNEEELSYLLAVTRAQAGNIRTGVGEQY